MIKLPTRHLFIHNETTDSEQLFSAAQFEAELAESFRAAGVYESWIPVEITEAVVDHLQLPRQQGHTRPLTRTRVDELVQKVLTDAGYPEVAARYCSDRGVTLHEKTTLNAETWTPDRIRRVIQAQVTDNDAALHAITAAAAEKLDSLGFDKVTDDLIIGIGRHILTNCNLSSDATSGRDKQTEDQRRLFLSVNPRRELDQESVRLLRENIVVLHSANRLLPLIRCTLDLAEYAGTLGSPPLTPLTLLPAIRPLSQYCRKILAATRQELLQECPHAAQHPARIYLQGAEELFRNLLIPMSVSERERLYAEMCDVLTECLSRNAAFDVVLTDTA